MRSAIPLIVLCISNLLPMRIVGHGGGELLPLDYIFAARKSPTCSSQNTLKQPWLWPRKTLSAHIGEAGCPPAVQLALNCHRQGQLTPRSRTLGGRSWWLWPNDRYRGGLRLNGRNGEAPERPVMAGSVSPPTTASEKQKFCDPSSATRIDSPNI